MPDHNLDARIRELFAELDAASPEPPPRPSVSKSPSRRWLQVGLPAVASAVVVVIAAVVIATPSDDTGDEAAATTTTVLAAPGTTSAAADETTTTAVGDIEPPISGVTFFDGWQVERGEVVAYGPDGAVVFDRIEGVQRPLTDDGLANLVAGPWGLVYQEELGELSQETTAPIWWISVAGDEPSLVFEGDGEHVMQIYDVVEWRELDHAVVRVEIDEENDLWYLVPLDGGQPEGIGTFGGGDVTTPCVASDSEALYLATVGTSASQIVRLAADGDWSAFLPGGPGDAWANATSCIASRPDGGFVVLVDEGPNEQGLDPPPFLLVILDSSGEIDSTLVLSDMSALVRVDATDNGVVLLSESGGGHWLNQEEGDDPVPLGSDHPFARFVR